MLKKIFLILFIPILFVFLAGLVAVFVWGREKLPVGEEGLLAEQLADKIQRAVHLRHWRDTAAISFVFSFGNRYHFRDNARGYREVVWDQYRVQYNRQSGHYIAWKKFSFIARSDCLYGLPKGF